jgi:hypothetical protein
MSFPSRPDIVHCHTPRVDSSYYERIGVRYAAARRADPRISYIITRALGDAASVVNVGAGTGSYEPSDGTVALAETRTRWTNPRGQVLHDEGEFGEGVGNAGSRRYVCAEVVEAPAEVLDEGVTSDDDPGGAISLQPAHRAKSGFEASVVGLYGVVGMSLRTMQGRGEDLVEDPGVEAVTVGGDLDG